jgi:hypothetical protein
MCVCEKLIKSYIRMIFNNNTTTNNNNNNNRELNRENPKRGRQLTF